METILITASALALVVGALVEVFKRATNVNKRYLPLVALILGALIGGLAHFIDADLATRIWAGGIAGLMAVGVFETGKNIKERD